MDSSLLAKFYKGFRYTVYFLLIAFLFFDETQLQSFGLKGPYTHEKINREAFRNFSKKTGYQIRLECAELINQSNFQADVFYPTKPEYHCDNSEFYKCSHQLDKLKSSSFDKIIATESLQDIGLSLHIVQDFYAHSNWAEIVKNPVTTAPIENFKEFFFLLFPNLQSGDHPYSLEGSPEDMVECYLQDESLWNQRITAATHACLEKDSNYSHRGGRIPNSALSFGKTYHEIAGELAIKHSTDLLLYYYNRRHPHLMSCILPNFKRFGCHEYAYDRLRANY